jgi:hypothetical protein
VILNANRSEKTPKETCKEKKLLRNRGEGNFDYIVSAFDESKFL